MIETASKGIGTGLGIAAMGIGMGIAFDAMRGLDTQVRQRPQLQKIKIKPIQIKW
jgi:hypothetical protein